MQQRRPQWGGFVDMGEFPWKEDKLCQVAHSKNLLADHIVDNQDKHDQSKGRLFVIVRYSFTGEDRKFYQLFYRSSGSNTHAKTWFPCDGLAVDNDGDELFVKVSHTKFVDKLKKKTSLIQYIQSLGIPELASPEDIKLKLLLRLGAPIFILLSFVLGGGLWSARDTRLKHKLLEEAGVSTEEKQSKSTLASLNASRPPESIKIRQLSLDKTTEEMCKYVQDAVSINNVPEEYKGYTTALAIPRVNLKTWIEGPVEIGMDNPALVRFKLNVMETLYMDPIPGIFPYRTIPAEFITSFEWRLTPAEITRHKKERLRQKILAAAKKKISK